MHNAPQNTFCMIGTEIPIRIITIKIDICIFPAETVTCICAAETSNCIIAAEAVTCIIVTDPSTYQQQKVHLKTCKNATDVFICIIAIERVSCIATSRINYRNFCMQKWCQCEILLVTIKKLSKRVSTNFKANSFSTLCIT